MEFKETFWGVCCSLCHCLSMSACNYIPNSTGRDLKCITFKIITTKGVLFFRKLLATIIRSVNCRMHRRSQGRWGGGTGAMAPPLGKKGGTILCFGPTFWESETKSEKSRKYFKRPFTEISSYWQHSLYN